MGEIKQTSVFDPKQKMISSHPKSSIISYYFWKSQVGYDDIKEKLKSRKIEKLKSRKVEK